MDQKAGDHIRQPAIMLLSISLAILPGSTATTIIAPAISTCKDREKHQQTVPVQVVLSARQPLDHRRCSIRPRFRQHHYSPDPSVLLGIYGEQTYIPQLTSPLTMQDYTCDSRSYNANQVTITGNLSQSTPSIAFASESLVTSTLPGTATAS